MRCSKFLLAMAMAGLLAGCAGSRQPAPVEELGSPAEIDTAFPADGAPSPMDPSPVGEAETIPLGAAGWPQSPSAGSTAPADAGAPANPAVVALLNDANLAMQNGRSDRAAASLERALSIEPRNAWLWHRLAGARFEQGDLTQAAALAAKSNAFAADDPKLQAANWRIIADVHRQRGDFDAAKSAQEQAARLESQ